MALLFACVVSVIVALFWGCIFALAGLNGWLLLIVCTVIFILAMVVMSMCNVAD